MLIEFDGKRPRIGKDVFIAPTAVLVGDVQVGDGTSIWFGAVLRADFGPIQIGRSCSIQDNTVIHSDSDFPTVIGDYVTIGHNVTAEGCRVGDHSLVGSGSVVLPFTTFGQRTLVAANSTVLERSEFPPDVLLAGSPAQIKRSLTGRALDWTRFAIDDYTELQARYRAQKIDRLKRS
ncbi:MAG: gamma carbonic anhydrase family protein [Candidatus Promineifilaceae bacterium]|nr:gamma carbonic anhydrase family protein [Candidatus Promineifilaceae bacterium]